VAEAIAQEQSKRERIPDFIEWVWRLRDRVLERYPRLCSFVYKYGVYLLIASFFLLYSSISILKHMNFQSHGWDLGIFDQTIWQYSRFEIGYSTVRLVPLLLADHWHPSLFLFAPSFWVWNDVRMLLIVQAAICALGAVPIYWIARDKLKSRFPQLCAVFIYLFFWGMLELIFFDFHPHCLYPPLIALMYYYVDRDNMIGFFLTLPFLLIIQEQVVLTAAFIGIWMAIFRRKWFEGGATFLISLGWFYAVSQKIIPGLAVGGAYAYNKYYEYLGGGDLIQAFKYLAFHPWTAVKLLFWPYHKTKLILALLVPFLFLPLMGSFIFIMIPDLLQRLYSSHFPHWELIRHYNAVYAAVLIIASMEALPRLHRILKKRYAGREIDYRKMVFAVLLVLVLLQFPFTFSRSLKTILNPSFYIRSERESTGYEALSIIPPDASVCAQDVVVPHLSHRELIYQYGCNVFKYDQVVLNRDRQYDGNTFNAEYVVLNKYYDCFPFPGQKELAFSIEDLYRDERYEVTNYGEGWLVFRLKPEYVIDHADS
jgi:uncharacterized membrane protein